jgi:hypothetical protein
MDIISNKFEIFNDTLVQLLCAELAYIKNKYNYACMPN